jgi:hypothetical protein
MLWRERRAGLGPAAKCTGYFDAGLRHFSIDADNIYDLQLANKGFARSSADFLTDSMVN